MNGKKEINGNCHGLFEGIIPAFVITQSGLSLAYPKFDPGTSWIQF
jgi:hypothetical protein